MPQYDNIAERYALVMATDPIKPYSHFPTMLQLLGDLNQKRILDIGCGGGHFSRLIAKAGAKVVGYDASGDQITIAQKSETSEPLGIQYFTAGPETFSYPDKFDVAFALLVIMHAENFESLVAFFQSAYNQLVDRGRFICMVDNTEFKRLGLPLYRRVRTITPESQMEIAFLDEKNGVITSVTINRFYPPDYECAAREAGFEKIEWHPILVTEEGREKMGEDFWHEYLGDDCPYRVFVVTKK